jgi:toxin-antitoxin system PIN domain toxin
MKHLCDVNFWVALVLGDHPSNALAGAWFGSLQEGDTALFCRSVQQGFFRVVSDANIFRQAALTNDVALECFRSLRNDPRIGWIEEPRGLEEKWLSYAKLSTRSPKVWMDAYLAAFAVMSGSRLVTFDRGFRVFRGLDWLDPSRAK